MYFYNLKLDNLKEGSSSQIILKDKSLNAVLRTQMIKEKKIPGTKSTQNHLFSGSLKLESPASVKQLLSYRINLAIHKIFCTCT